MALGNYLSEGAFDPVAILLREHERRQEFYCVARMSSNLHQNPVMFAERDRDQLAEKTCADCFQNAPRRPESQRTGAAEFDADHEPLATDFPDHLIVRHHGLERREQTRPQ